jgi:CubicO group peptidase (beta-lactamase class C family)
MRASRVALLLLLFSCGPAGPRQTQPAPPAPPPVTTPPVPGAPATGAPAPAPPAKEQLAADTPRTTISGNTFVAPAGWTIYVQGAATILESPEGDSHIALVDVKAGSADEALELAWKAYKPDHAWPLEVKSAGPDRDGWTKIAKYAYQTSPNEKRIVAAEVRFANDTWTVALVDAALATAEKRGAQLGVVFGKLLPRGGARESFAGKQANLLDAARIAELGKFVESSQQLLGVPGVAVGLVQGGKVVFAGGFGVREQGKPAKVDADTRFIIASNTKALTTLMLAKLVDEQKLAWETAATSLLPRFKLGDAETTSKVQVRHLICACTGMPRQDFEWLFEFKDLTPERALDALGKMQPTSKFGELFQYSNPLAAAAGFIGGHVAFPKLELGAAYDEAMRTRVFDPLGMKATTFDFRKAQTGDFAVAHGHDLDGKTVRALDAINRAVIPVRPAGGAWSTVRDMLRYVQMELAEGKLPDGKTYVSKEALLARRAPQVAIGTDITYGMGLMVNRKYGVTVVSHGGDLLGFHSDMMWLPEHGVGAVVLTNGDGGALIRSVFQRKLLEVLFDGRAEADALIAAGAKQIEEQRAATRKLIEVPASAAEAGKLAARYGSPELGELTVRHKGAALVFDFGEFATEMASQKNPDGSVSFVTIAPGIIGLPLVAGMTAGGKRTLVMRDAQHEYVFEEKDR